MLPGCKITTLIVILITTIILILITITVNLVIKMLLLARLNGGSMVDWAPTRVEEGKVLRPTTVVEEKFSEGEKEEKGGKEKKGKRGRIL